MPLFGKKKKSEGSSASGYPKQPAYPTQQPAYPVQQQQPPQQPGGQPSYPYPPQQSGLYPQQAQYSGPPPPYQPHPVQPPPAPAQQPVVQQTAQPRGSGVNSEDLTYLALASPYYGYGYGGGLLAAAAIGGLASGQQNTGEPVTSIRQPTVAPGQQVAGVYDQGARFDSNRPPTIPPPPPGVAPTASQLATAQGQSVSMSQQRRDDWGLGSDGGATFF